MLKENWKIHYNTSDILWNKKPLIQWRSRHLCFEPGTKIKTPSSPKQSLKQTKATEEDSSSVIERHGTSPHMLSRCLSRLWLNNFYENLKKIAAVSKSVMERHHVKHQTCYQDAWAGCDWFFSTEDLALEVFLHGGFCSWRCGFSPRRILLLKMWFFFTENLALEDVGFSPRRILLLKMWFFSTENFALEDGVFLHGEFCSWRCGFSPRRILLLKMWFFSTENFALEDVVVLHDSPLACLPQTPRLEPRAKVLKPL